MARSNSVLAELCVSLENLRNGRGEVENVAKFAKKLVVQAARVSSFYEILRRRVLFCALVFSLAIVIYFFLSRHFF